MPSTRAVTRNLAKRLQRGAPQDPFHHLPDEIIVHILSLCVPNYSDWPHPNISSAELANETPVLAPLAMTHVCSTWRVLVLRTKSLWTTPFVLMGQVTADNPSAQELRASYSTFQCLQLAMERSHPMPIRPFVTCTDAGGHRRGAWMKIINFIIKHSERIEAISLHLTPPGAVARLLNGEARFPVLKELYIMCLEHMRESSWSDAGILGAPQLTTVTLKIPGLWILPEVPFAAQVTRLSISDTYARLFGILEATSRLKELHILPFDEGDDLNPNSAPIVLPNLTNLYVWTTASLKPVFRHLSIPSLTSLSLSTTEPGKVWDGPSFEGFITRSACNLVSLKFDQVAMTTPELIALLKLVPALEELTIYEPEHLATPFLSAIFLMMFALPAPDLRPKQPKLRKLELDNAKPFQKDLAYKFFNMRLKMGHPLRSFVALIQDEEGERVMGLTLRSDREVQRTSGAPTTVTQKKISEAV